MSHCSRRYEVEKCLKYEIRANQFKFCIFSNTKYLLCLLLLHLFWPGHLQKGPSKYTRSFSSFLFFFLLNCIFPHQSWLLRGQTLTFNSVTNGLVCNYIGLSFFLFSPNFGAKKLENVYAMKQIPTQSECLCGQPAHPETSWIEVPQLQTNSTKNEQLKADGSTPKYVVGVAPWHSNNQEHSRMHFNWIVCCVWDVL